MYVDVFISSDLSGVKQEQLACNHRTFTLLNKGVFGQVVYSTVRLRIALPHHSRKRLRCGSEIRQDFRMSTMHTPPWLHDAHLHLCWF